MSDNPRIVIVPVGPPPGNSETGLWSAAFEGFGDTVPILRGWRGTLAEVLDKVKYAATTHDLTRGERAPDWFEEHRERVGRFRAFWESYAEDLEVRLERDRLRGENASLRDALAAQRSDAQLPVG